MFSWIPRDARILYGTVALRSLASGFVSVLLGIYLKGLGYGPAQVGAFLTASLAGSAVLTLLVSLFSDRLGRRRTLVLLAALTAVGAFLFTQTRAFVPLLVLAFFANLSTTSKERGGFLVIEQASLPQTVSSQRRTSLFAYYNVVETLGASLGALLSALPVLLQRLAIDTQESYRLVFGLYAMLALTTALLYSRLSPAIEASPQASHGYRLSAAAKRKVYGLSVLFALDALGGGFVIQSFVSYWFLTRFNLDLGSLAGLFFAANILSSLSFTIAARLADRIGLINTMVFTHIPSSLLLMAVAVAPWAWLAVAFYLARSFLSQMDVPTRQSYIVAIVAAEERTRVSGITTLARNISQAVSPVVAGALVASAALVIPFLLSGAVKIVYDLLLFASFRNVKTPEEVSRSSPQDTHPQKADRVD